MAYKFGEAPAVYALEGTISVVFFGYRTIRVAISCFAGSVAVAGAAMKWLRDNMGFIKDIGSETESLAQEVFNTGDVYFVPAFKGLYAPYWRKDARGCVSFQPYNHPFS